MIGCHEVVMCHCGGSCVFPTHALLPHNAGLFNFHQRNINSTKINQSILLVLVLLVFTSTIYSLKPELNISQSKKLFL